MRKTLRLSAFAVSVLSAVLLSCGGDGGGTSPSDNGIDSCVGDYNGQIPAGFSASGYASANPDLVAYFCADGACDSRDECNALMRHWIDNGQAEGRSWGAPVVSSQTQGSSASGGQVGKANRIGFVSFFNAARAEEVDFARYTQFNAFGAKVNADGSLNTSEMDGAAAFQATIAEGRNRGLPVLLTVGGDGRSGNMSSVFGNDGLRQSFVNAALAYVQAKGWQGIDIDWEFPSTDGDDAALTATLKALHDAFAPHGLKVSIDMPTDLHITMGKAKINPDFAAYVDQINVMTYDYVATGYGPHDPNDKVFATMDYWLAQGLPAGKLNMGIAFYGRDCRVSSSNAPQIAWKKAYYETCMNVDNADNCLGDRSGTFRARTYWVYGGAFVDNALTLVDGWAERIDYLATKNLAGVLYWEVSQDVPLNDTTFPSLTQSSLNFRIATHIDELLQATDGSPGGVGGSRP